MYAATSRYEPFGLAALEAALAGCALVMSDIPTFRELWDGCALFYTPGDVAGLVAAIRELVDRSPARVALARAAQARAHELYTPERMVAGYEEVYAQALQAGALSTQAAAAPAARTP